MKLMRPLTDTVAIGATTFSYDRRWSGRPLSDRGYLALDTETELIGDEGEIPRLALASASAGGSANAIVHPDQLGTFLLAHPRQTWVFHNAAFDFWVIDRHLADRGEDEARQVLWDACDRNRVGDTMLLDLLIALARGDADLFPRNLAQVGLDYGGFELDKSDPYRLRYGEIIGRDWDEVDDGFFAYAIKDAIVTLEAYRRMVLKTERIVHEFAGLAGDIRDHATRDFGPLSEAVQVKGAIALAMISRNGMHVDVAGAGRAETEMRATLDERIADLLRICPDLYRTRVDPVTGDTTVVTTASGAPSRDNTVLSRELERVERKARAAGTPLVISSKTRGLSRSAKVWAEHTGVDPFVAAWIEVERLAKLAQFFAGLRSDVVRPTYRPLLQTGRTSCTRPNIQQIPRMGPFRSAFVASPGHLILAIDYAFIELRTLAATCVRRYGHSVLADVIRRGVDPHAYTAALILGVDPQEFLAWKDDPTPVDDSDVTIRRADRFKSARQAAKAINFGVPGGLGAATLMATAHATYGVELSLAEAAEFRDKLIGEIYPELGRYLAEDGMSLLARGLGTVSNELWAALDRDGTRSGAIVGGVRRVVSGKTQNAKGQPYSSHYLDLVWSTLARCCRVAALRPALERREAGLALAGRLFGSAVATLTGRIRSNVSYTQCRNTPFQGLAADGAKLALWRLIREGFRVIAFIHDEVLIELPERDGSVDLERVEAARTAMCEAMAGVLIGDIPVSCEMTLSRCWSKDAGLVIRDGRAYPSESGGSPA